VIHELIISYVPTVTKKAYVVMHWKVLGRLCFTSKFTTIWFTHFREYRLLKLHSYFMETMYMYFFQILNRVLYLVRLYCGKCCLGSGCPVTMRRGYACPGMYEQAPAYHLHCIYSSWDLWGAHAYIWYHLHYFFRSFLNNLSFFTVWYGEWNQVSKIQ